MHIGNGSLAIPVRHIILFESQRGEALLDVRRLAEWQHAHGIALLICSTVSSLKLLVRTYCVELVIIAAGERDIGASRAARFLRTVGIDCPRLPKAELPQATFDPATFDPIPHRQACARIDPGSERPPDTHRRCVDWTGFLSDARLFPLLSSN